MSCLTSVNGQAYTWDNNGNLLNDGTNTYVYDAANRLTSVTGGGNTSTYAYNGLGDRLSQTVNAATTNYALDLNAGLTQVLSDGTNTYLYGNGRIGELQPGGFTYHLGDALGSVRQLADAGGAPTLTRSYEPYGKVLSSSGTGSTAYGFAGEWTDNTGLIHLRARYYASYLNQWIQPDPIIPDIRSPQTLNRYAYVNNNPVNFTDPSGLCTDCYVFFFAGLGNQGNMRPDLGPIDRSHGANELDNDLGPGELRMVEELRRRTSAIVIPVYPYGEGMGGVYVDDPIAVLPVLGPVDSNRNLRNAVYPSAYDKSNIPAIKAIEIAKHIPGACSPNENIAVDDDKVTVTFVGYSGGGQMAYSTAQKLKGKVFVDNLVMFASSFRAHNGMSNIGRLWDFVGEQDTFFAHLGETVRWDLYNRGYRGEPGLHNNRLDIYENGATRCVLFGDSKKPYEHFYSYFDENTGFQGLSCRGHHTEDISRQVAQRNNVNRFEANMTFLVAIIEGTLK